MQLDRHLLLGLLALQCGLISDDQLVAAFRVWMSDKQRSIEGILFEQKALTSHQLAVLHQLEQELLDKHSQSTEESLATLSKIGPVRQQLEELSDAQLGATLSRLPNEWKEPFATPTNRLGNKPIEGIAVRYQAIRLHAKGGVGEVYVARDSELNREVALKEIQDQFANDQESRARFKLEAEITGNLEHPGIVPVYGLGQYDNGRPYYAMRFIRGDSLKDAIDAFHNKHKSHISEGEAGLELRKLLRRFIDVCNAVAYAHSRGVLHRDLKPGNIILGKYGETLVVDWGLARAQGQSESIDATLGPIVPSSGSGITPTMVGSAVGTPVYMSPEQAAGKIDSLGPTTDVYALGATLFHLLTGQLPITGKTLLEIVQKAENGEIRRPRAIRSDVPMSLDAICIQAMAKEPAQRYASSEQLAEDIEKWLADEPISAYVEPLSVRIRRWIRRHPAIVSTSAACVVLGFCAAIGVVFLQSAHAKELEGKNKTISDQVVEVTKQKREAENERTRAEEREQDAIAAVKRFGDVVANNSELKNNPKLESLRKELLKEPLGFFKTLKERLHADQSTRKESLSRLASAAFELGNLTDEIGDKQDALIAYIEAKKVQEQLVLESPHIVEFAIELVGTNLNLGNTFRATGNPAQATAAYEEARVIAQQLSEEHPNVAEYASRLATSHVNIAILLRDTGKLNDAISACREANKIRKRLALENSDKIEYASELAHSLNILGVLLSETGEPEKALTAHDQAKEIIELLAREVPDVPEYHLELARTQINAGCVLRELGRSTEAQATFEKANSICELLVREHPAVIEFASELSGCHNNIGILFQENGHSAEALVAFKEAKEIRSRLVNENSSAIELAIELAQINNNLGGLLNEMDLHLESIAALEEAKKLQERLTRDYPNQPEYAKELAGCHSNLGVTLNSMGKVAEAIAAHKQAVEIRERLSREFPAEPAYSSQLAQSHNSLGVLFSEIGEHVSANSELEEARKIGERLTIQHPTIPAIHSDLGQTYSQLALLRIDAEASLDSAQLLRMAIDSQKRALTASPKNPTYRQLLKAHYLHLRSTAEELEDKQLFMECEKACVELSANDPQFAEIDQRLFKIARGEPTLDSDDLLTLGQRALDLQKYSLATRFYLDAIKHDALLVENREIQIQYNGACSAALAASGQGEADPPLNDDAKTKHRSQAFTWLKQELTQWQTFLGENSKPEAKQTVAKTLAHWQQDSDLASIRDADKLATFPEVERKEWEALWAEVKALHAKVSAEAVAPKAETKPASDATIEKPTSAPPLPKSEASEAPKSETSMLLMP